MLFFVLHLLIRRLLRLLVRTSAASALEVGRVDVCFGSEHDAWCAGDCGGYRAGEVSLFLADPQGGVYTCSASTAGDWGEWTSVSEASTTPGAPVTAVVTRRGRCRCFWLTRRAASPLRSRLSTRRGTRLGRA